MCGWPILCIHAKSNSIICKAPVKDLWACKSREGISKPQWLVPVLFIFFCLGKHSESIFPYAPGTEIVLSYLFQPHLIACNANTYPVLIKYKKEWMAGYKVAHRRNFCGHERGRSNATITINNTTQMDIGNKDLLQCSEPVMRIVSGQVVLCPVNHVLCVICNDCLTCHCVFPRSVFSFVSMVSRICSSGFVVCFSFF